MIGNWTAVNSYSINDTVIGSDGNLYKSLIDYNSGHDPTTNNIAWKQESTNTPVSQAVLEAYNLPLSFLDSRYSQSGASVQALYLASPLVQYPLSGSVPPVWELDPGLPPPPAQTGTDVTFTSGGLLTFVSGGLYTVTLIAEADVGGDGGAFTALEFYGSSSGNLADPIGVASHDVSGVWRITASYSREFSAGETVHLTIAQTNADASKHASLSLWAWITA